ncbi:HERC1 [Symbiodinium necroappetens]|uniref:HERC1 protein n=1 Tax=Symbiodinium necroappetens TaxID=1628268 RepID=A0A812MAR2_9DINO|nr:HERC1 [Symbiodinium necroappetens]
MPSGVAVRHVSCGDCHSCASHEKRRVWFGGAGRKRRSWRRVHQRIPTLVLEVCLQIASGANHTVALAAPSGHNQVFAWGSNAMGQLGLEDACGFSERTLPCSGSVAGLAPREGGGCEVAGEQVVRIHQADGSVRAATSMTAEQVQQAVVQGATALVLQVAEREVPKPEKQKLLRPQHVPLEVGAGEHVASSDGAVAWSSVERRWLG